MRVALIAFGRFAANRRGERRRRERTAQEMAQLSLIGELPKILDEGRKEAARILERLGDPVKIGLQTNELVLPAKDVDGLAN